MGCADCQTCVFDSALRAADYVQQIHITVADCDEHRFKAACEKIGAKALVINNIFRDGRVRNDIITSSVCYGGDEKAHAEMARLVEQLQSRRFRVLRQKIETSPAHPLVPTRHNNRRMLGGQYFESHIAVATESQNCVDMLATVAKQDRMFLSRSAAKSGKTTMATLRCHSGTFEGFRERLDESVGHLVGHGLGVERTIIEFARYDSNAAHDAAWMSS